MKTENGQIAWLSVNTQRIFKTYDEAQKDAKFYLIFFNKIDEKTANKLSNYDVYAVNLWLNEKQ